jgi:mannitol/fructose-specific phosphotransferase system IIA component (Ntr-type)
MRPVVVVGQSAEGVDFDSPDGAPARLIFLVLTPLKDQAAQVQIVGQIARAFHLPEARRLIYEGESLDVIRAHVKIESVATGHS